MSHTSFGIFVKGKITTAMEDVRIKKKELQQSSCHTHPCLSPRADRASGIVTVEATLFCLDRGMAIGRLLVDAEELDPAPASKSTSIKEAVRKNRRRKEAERRYK